MTWKVFVGAWFWWVISLGKQKFTRRSYYLLYRVYMHYILTLITLHTLQSVKVEVLRCGCETTRRSSNLNKKSATTATLKCTGELTRDQLQWSWWERSNRSHCFNQRKVWCEEERHKEATHWSTRRKEHGGGKHCAEKRRAKIHNAMKHGAKKHDAKKYGAKMHGAKKHGAKTWRK